MSDVFRVACVLSLFKYFSIFCKYCKGSCCLECSSLAGLLFLRDYGWISDDELMYEYQTPNTILVLSGLILAGTTTRFALDPIN